MPTSEALRFEAPLYTLKDAAWYLDVPEQTVRRWAGRSSPWKLVTARDGAPRGEAVVPFIGLAEAFVVSAFRRQTGKRLKADYLLSALQYFHDHMGIDHALASDRLYLHGQQFLYDYAQSDAQAKELAEVLTQNRVMEKVVEGELKKITYRDGYAGRIVLPITQRPVAVADPLRAFGEPLFIRGEARIVDVLDRFDAGDDPEGIASDFEVPVADVLDIVRAASKRGRQAA